MQSQKYYPDLIDMKAKISLYRAANTCYLEIGGHIIDPARKAYELYQKQNNRECRRLLDYVVSELSYEGGTVYVTYRKPFDLFDKTVKTKNDGLCETSARNLKICQN